MPESEIRLSLSTGVQVPGHLTFTESSRLQWVKLPWRLLQKQLHLAGSRFGYYLVPLAGSILHRAYKVTLILANGKEEQKVLVVRDDNPNAVGDEQATFMVYPNLRELTFFSNGQRPERFWASELAIEWLKVYTHAHNPQWVERQEQDDLTFAEAEILLEWQTEALQSYSQFWAMNLPVWEDQLCLPNSRLCGLPVRSTVRTFTFPDASTLTLTLGGALVDHPYTNH